jgi:hypothetical protein
MADGSQIHRVIASAPGRDERDDDCGNGQTDDDPYRIHEPSPSFPGILRGSSINAGVP